MTDAPSTRDPVRTRRAILDAAGRSVLAEGSSVSLETIAREAGVSKGGLLHHFGNKDALYAALAEDVLDRFAADVYGRLDADDTGPGRLIRAYVRASFDELRSGENARKEAGLMAAIGVIPEVIARTQEDGRRWREAVAGDGLDRGRASVIMRAADGISAASLFEGSLDDDELLELRDLLLALSRDPGPLAAPLRREGGTR